MASDRWTEDVPHEPGFYWVYTNDWDGLGALVPGLTEMIYVISPSYGWAHSTAGGVLHFENVAFWRGPIEPPSVAELMFVGKG